MRNLSILFIVLSIFYSGCIDCSRSKRRNAGVKQNMETNNEEHNRRSVGKTVVKMEKINGVFQIPTEVNGVAMHFIFDTGASIISISETEAIFLYKQGKLTNEDIKGSANFSDANGDISEGTIINLKTVKIGKITLSNI